MARDEQWAVLLRDLAEYRDQHGHVDVPRGFRTEAGAGLGAWVHRQRTLYVGGSLPEDRAAQLNTLGLRWRVNERSRGIEEYFAFVAQHGHGRVPSTTVTATGFSLGTWVQSRRREYQQDSLRTLRLWPELTGEGFVWQLRDRDAQWQAGIRQLERYRAVHGDCLVPAGWVTGNGFPLGKWVETRRTEYRAGTLDLVKVDTLDLLGMVWWLREITDISAREARELAQFRQRCVDFGAYVTAKGTTYMPTRYTTENGEQLGRWLLRQRRLHRQGALSLKRLSILETISTNWNLLPPAGGGRR